MLPLWSESVFLECGRTRPLGLESRDGRRKVGWERKNSRRGKRVVFLGVGNVWVFKFD
jgi:hypothetical protein